MTSSNEQLNPADILQVGTAFWSSKVLLTAVSEGLFTYLVQKPHLLSEIKSQFGWNCTDRHVSDFLDTLFALKFLQRKGSGNEAVYWNTPETDFFLDKNKPSYIGGILEMANHRLFRFWANLEDGLKTGLPQNEMKHGGENLFDAIYRSPELLRNFIQAMTGLQMANFITLALRFDFSKYKTLCDIGGAGGMLSIQVSKLHPHIRCSSFDLPPVEPIAREIIQSFQLSDQIKTVKGDFLTDAFPTADIIVMGNILHDWNEEKKCMLIKKAYDALPQNGVLIAIENIIDNQRSQNVFGLTMSLNMLIETGEGFDYTIDDFAKWAKVAGFKTVDLLPLAGPTSAAIAYK